MGRAILNISLPPEIKKDIEKRAKKVKKSISAYILHAVQLEQSLIHEDELALIMDQAERDYNEGKTKVLNTLSDLMD